jgi:hypothetical protein
MCICVWTWCKYFWQRKFLLKYKGMCVFACVFVWVPCVSTSHNKFFCWLTGVCCRPPSPLCYSLWFQCCFCYFCVLFFFFYGVCVSWYLFVVVWSAFLSFFLPICFSLQIWSQLRLYPSSAFSFFFMLGNPFNFPICLNSSFRQSRVCCAFLSSLSLEGLKHNRREIDEKKNSSI